MNPVPALSHSSELTTNPNEAGKAVFRVSFVIPAHNEESMLPTLVRSIQLLSLADGVLIEEVIVADAESSDATAEVASVLGCRVVPAVPGAAGAARNAGAAVAVGNVLAFVDADCVLPEDWLQQVADALTDDRAVAMSTSMAPPERHDSWVAKTWFELTRQKDESSDAQWLPSFNFAVRTNAFRAVGGFDESLTTCEDVELSLRLKPYGQLKRGSGRAVAHIGASQSLTEFFQREAWRSQGALALLKNHWNNPREVLGTLLPLTITGSLLLTVVMLSLRLLLRTAGSEPMGLFLMAVSAYCPVTIILLVCRQRVSLQYLPRAAFLLLWYCMARSAGSLMTVARVTRRA